MSGLPLTPAHPAGTAERVQASLASAPLSADERALCAATAHLLDAGARVLGTLSLALLAGLTLWVGLAGRASGAATGAILPAGFIALLLVWTLALPERWLAFRLRFDAGLFADLAGGRIGALTGLDKALQSLFGARLAVAPGSRGVVDRVGGAQRLLRWHLAVVAGQGLALLLFAAAWQLGAA